jgi:hypothetical protein
MGPTRNQTAREALLRDVLAVDQPAPELLVRYAQAPDSLDAEERRLVEEALARSPATADQLRVLQSFDVALLDDALEPELVPATSRRGPLAALRRFLGALAAPQPARVWIPAAVGTALLVAFLSARFVQTREVERLQQELAAAEAQLHEERGELAKARQEASKRSELASLRKEVETQHAKKLAAMRERPTGRPSESLIAYVPPLRAAPRMRVGGGTRSATSALPKLAALTPAHQGQTIKTAPSVYWFLSERTTQPIELTVSDPESDEAVLDVTLPGPHAAGIHGVDLAARGVRLSRARTYQWFVVILVEDVVGGDVMSGGAIRRVAPSEELEDELRRAGAAGAAHVYAKHGIWYDALAEISARIDSAPGDAWLREQRVGLLEQVGLDRAAAYDRDH